MVTIYGKLELTKKRFRLEQVRLKEAQAALRHDPALRKTLKRLGRNPC